MEKIRNKNQVFSLANREETTTGYRQNALKLFSKPLEHLLSLTNCSDIYDRIADTEEPGTFLDSVLEALDITPVFSLEEQRRIPAKGGAVVVANHPFGAIEGIILAKLLVSVRPDVKIMANYILKRIPRLSDLFISVDPFDGTSATRHNIRPIRDAIRWVKNGGLLMVFPAGEVSHVNVTKLEISDPDWHTGVAQIIRKAEVPVVPVFFKGNNGPLFQMLGLVHPKLRTAMLPRELINKRQKCIPLKIGKAIPFRRLKRYETNKELIDYLRWRTYLLGKGLSLKKSPTKLSFRSWLKNNKQIIPPRPISRLAAEVNRLPRNQQLVQSGDFEVWQAKAYQIPELLVEIGRLRELNFRAASEGTGKPIDLDAYDRRYIHIFIWNKVKSEIVGAYRIGCTDTLLERFGKNGIYTATLFRSSNRFYKTIGPALELGRSFVRSEYQKSYAPLLLLWKGIGHFIAKNPQYRMLFGPVSISKDYSYLSRKLIATTLLKHSQAKEVAAMIRPKTPPKFKPVRIPGFDFTRGQQFFHDIEEICSVIADIELEVKTIPVLLRHYMNLGGQLLAFNMDRSFSNCMDGLILVDLLKTDTKTLERYMGKTGLENFYSYHQALENSSVERKAKRLQEAV